MMIVGLRRLKANILLKKWIGRAGVVVLQSTWAPPGTISRIAICNVHGAHGNAFLDSLTDVRKACKCIPYQTTKFLCGDWNVDQLPTCSGDPFAHDPQRRNRHRQERQYLKALFDRMGVNCCLPQSWATFCVLY